MTTYYTYVESPVGPLLLTSDGERLTGIYFDYESVNVTAWVRRDDAAPFGETERQLGEYFAGARSDFDLPLAPSGTDFQRRVWEALRAIPYGATRTYSELAASIGQPSATRAVASACANNRLALVIPCHRVIAKGGGIAGYRWGVERKRELLGMEDRSRDTLPRHDSDE